MDDLAELLIERSCRRLLLDCCRFVDFGNAGRLAELFTDDGVWEADDRFRRTPDGWRFAHHHVDVDFLRAPSRR